jgi:hypothetical protein
MASKQNVFSMENPVFASFAFYSLAVLLKMLAIQLSVVFRRLTRNVSINCYQQYKFTCKRQRDTNPNINYPHNMLYIYFVE